MPPKLKTTIAQMVIQEAERQGVTRRELAGVIGVDPSDLSRWLTGSRSIRVLYAERAMAYLGIRLLAPEPLQEDATGRSHEAGQKTSKKKQNRKT